MQCAMDHIVLNVENEDAMIAFYSDTLMLAMERLAQYRAGEVPFPSVRLNADTVIDLFPKKMWAQDAPAAGHANLNHFCIALARSDWEQLRERLKARDVAIEMGPAPRWGAHGTGTSIYFRDPDGNVVEARYYDDGNPEDCLLSS